MGIFQRMGERGGSSGRLRWVLWGFLLGVVWGTIMWAITGTTGGGTVWLYIALTTGMIGAGVAAIFGAMNARKKGERISPRIMPKDPAERKAESKAAKAEARAQAKAEADARKQSH